jgi:hypothetical protein
MNSFKTEEPLDFLNQIHPIHETKLNIDAIYERYQANKNRHKKIHNSFLLLLLVSAGMQIWHMKTLKNEVHVEATESNSSISLSIYH